MACGHARCRNNRLDIAVLYLKNPRSFWSVKVMHNIGKRRQRKLKGMVIDAPVTPPATNGTDG